MSHLPMATPCMEECRSDESLKASQKPDIDSNCLCLNACLISRSQWSCLCTIRNRYTKTTNTNSNSTYIAHRPKGSYSAQPWRLTAYRTLLPAASGPSYCVLSPQGRVLLQWRLQATADGREPAYNEAWITIGDGGSHRHDVHHPPRCASDDDLADSVEM